MRIVMMGLAGSGKGTLAKDLVAGMGPKTGRTIPHISTGDVFREILSRDDALSADLKKYVTTGLLVPDDVTCRVAEDRLSRPDCAPGFLLDGFPRNLVQAEWLQSYLAKKGQALDLALSLRVENDVALKRLLGRISCSQCKEGYNTFFSPPKKEGVCDRCGAPLKKRPDDDEKVIRKRVAEDVERVAALEAFYAKAGILKAVKGDGTPKVVADRAWETVLAAVPRR